MIKRIAALLFLAALLISSSALADYVWVDAFADRPDDAAMTEYLAAEASAQLGTQVSVHHEKDEVAAVNAFLTLPADESVLIAGPDAMICSLQAMTDQDLRTALIPVTDIAQSDSLFCVSPAAAGMVAELTADALEKYTQENEYSLTLMRTMDASYDDMLALAATGEFFLEEELYADWAEMEQAMQDGLAGLAVFSACAVPDDIRSYVSAGSTGMPGLWQGVFLNEKAGSGPAEKLYSVLQAACSGPEWEALLSQAGYNASPCLAPADFAVKVSDETERITRYLTNEGLFFYEW